MAEDTDFEDIEGGDGSDQDSAVVRALRKEIKTLKAEIRAAKAEVAEAATVARQQYEREQQAHKIVNDLGYPGLASLAVEKIEGEVTEESALAFLEGLGLKAQSESDTGTEVAVSSPKGVESVANLGQQIASAARGTANLAVEARLAAAQTPQEIEQIAREAGFFQS